MELDGTQSVKKILTKNPTTMSLSRNHNLISHHAEGSESQLLLWPNCVYIITWRTGAQKYLSQLRFWNFFFVASQPPQNELEPFSPITFGKSRKAFYGYLVSHALNQKLIPIVSSEHALWAPQYGRFGYFYSHWAASWREANQLANVADQKDSLALTCLNFAHRVDAVIQLVGVVW